MLSVENWWYALSVISIFNILLWLFSYRLLRVRENYYSARIYRNRLIIIWLSSAYVAVCAFRSFLPRIDVERICLVDHWLSNILLGRTLTTIAELFFIAQCALLLYEAGNNSKNSIVVKLSVSLIPIIIIAEGFSWYASITTHYLASVVEESLWALSGLIIIAGGFLLLPQSNSSQRSFLIAVILFGISFLVFMLFVDIPMYWQRYLDDVESSKIYIGIWQGLHDMAVNYRVSLDSKVWMPEMPWMSLYFTVAVWISIFLPHTVIIRPRSQV